MEYNSQAEFVSVQEYRLEYGHNGKHVKIIRTRYDTKDSSTIKFILLTIDLIRSKIKTKYVSVHDVKDLFEQYYPELPERFVREFIEGIL